MTMLDLHDSNPGNRKPNPEDALAIAESRLSMPIADMAASIHAMPNCSFNEFSVPASIEAAIAENRYHLSRLPDQSELERLVSIARAALATSTPRVVKREVANLVGSFPNASLASPETYLTALVFDLMSKGIPDAIVVLACRNLRRSCRFVPSIAEVLALADDMLRRWQCLDDLVHELPVTRAQLEEAVRRGEKMLAFVQGEIADGYRDAGGRIIRHRTAYQRVTQCAL